MREIGERQNGKLVTEGAPEKESNILGDIDEVMGIMACGMKVQAEGKKTKKVMMWKKRARLESPNSTGNSGAPLAGVRKTVDMPEPKTVDANRKKGRWAGDGKNELKKAAAISQPRQMP
jgi:hypothetical protein